MALDLSLQAVVNSAGAVLFGAVGVFALAVGDRVREHRLAGALAIAFGVTYVVTNLFPYGTRGALAPTMAISGAVAALAIALALDLSRGLPSRSRRASFVFGSALLAATAFYLAYGTSRLPEMGRAVGLAPEDASVVALGLASFVVSTSALSYLACVLALVVHATPREQAARRKALALQACAYALYAVFTTSQTEPVFTGLNALVVVALAPVAAWALTSQDAVGRRVTLTLVAVGLVGLGLLMGGVVAGALLVAARPIERAFDGRREPTAPVVDDDKLAVYRDAARRSLREGRVTREEEMHLARLARHLSIPHDVALRIRHDVEDELGSSKA